MAGYFITIEGGEGAGKSTALGFIHDYLQSAGINTLCTREPGGTQLGEQLRELLLNPEQPSLCAEAELLMMFAARAQHLQQVIYPALNAGQWVLCDRFTDASFAYQGAGRELGMAKVAQLETWLQQQFRPQQVFVLDIDPQLGMQRVRQRGAVDRFEQEGQAFFQRVRQAYLERAKQDPTRYSVIDASQELAGVQAQLSQSLRRLLRQVDSQARARGQQSEPLQ
jgi:dTMP kinase